MAKNNPRQDATGWRDFGGEKAPTSTGRRGWQQQEAPTGSRRPMSKQSKLVIAMTLLCLFLGGAMVVIYWLRPIKPASIVFLGAGYETNLLLPPNVLGWNGAHQLAEWADRPSKGKWAFVFDLPTRMRRISLSGDVNKIHELTPTKTWQSFWEEVPQSISEKMLVVYLSLHGASDEKGAYLFADDPRGQAKVYVDDIFKALQQPGWREKNLVLVIDSPHVLTHWPLGMLRNDFVAKLKEQFEKEHPANLAVICACDENQVSWTSEELQSSIFAHYFLEGLRGAADTTHSARRISLQQLFDYVSEKVGAWVKSNRNMVQTPILLPAKLTKDIDLLAVDDSDADESVAEKRSGTFKAGKELKERWASWEALQEASPWTFAPQLWRRYQSGVLRMEHLERAGDPTRKLGDLNRELADLESRLRALPRLEAAKDALPYSLPMLQALGNARPSAEQGKQWLRALKDNPDRPAAWKEFHAAADASVPPEAMSPFLARLLINDLLAKGNELTPTDLQGVADFWKKEVEAEFPRFAEQRSGEMQLLTILQRDLAGAPGSLIHLTLKVRRSAEQAPLGEAKGATYPYSEFIYPWIEGDLTQADEERRRGEDWLLGSKQEHWNKAKGHLEAADALYEKVKKDAALVRDALTTRDRAWADLPNLTQWIFAQPNRTVAHEERLMAFTRNLRALTKHLDVTTHPKIQDPVLTNPPMPLAELTEKIASEQRAILNEYAELARSLKGTVIQERIHFIDAVLNVPLPGADRESLIQTSRAITNTLLKVGSGKEGIVALPKESADRREALARLVYQEAYERESETLAAGLARMPSRVLKGVKSSLDQDDLEKADDELLLPAQLCRVIPGGMADREDEFTAVNGPATALRQIRVQRLLLAQAGRTLRDHYWSVPIEMDAKGRTEPADDSKVKEPYCTEAAKAYVRAARQLSELASAKAEPEKKEARLKALDNWTSLLQPASLSAAANRNLIWWTTEQRLPLAWRVQAAGGVPAGTPMLWHELGAGPKKAERMPVEGWTTQGQAQLIAQAPTTVQEKDWPASDEPLPVRLLGVYRGQRLGGAAAKVVLKRRDPDVIVDHYIPPNHAAIAIRMDEKFTYGAVSIVLDTSGSMDWEFPTKKGADGFPMVGKRGNRELGIAGNRRFDRALDALEKVLTTLPDGTYLSILRFTKTGTEFFQLDENDQISKVWQKDRLPRLLRKLEEIELYNIGSPIAKGIQKSMEAGFPDGYKGPKVTLALTDGSDNLSIKKEVVDIEKDLKQYNQAVRGLLAEANRGNPDVKAVVVCFIQPGDEEFKIAEDQFATVASFAPLPGSFKIESDAAKLGTTIEELLRPRLQLIPAVPGFRDLIGHAQSQNLDWQKVPPGVFETKVQKQTTNPVKLDRGQKMLLLLKRDREIFLEPVPIGALAEAKEAYMSTQAVGNWLATLFQNELDNKDKKREQVVLLERAPTVEDRHKQLRRDAPEMVWLDLKPANAKLEGLLRWHNDWNIPALAFRLQVEKWRVDPDTGRAFVPKLDAWWGTVPSQGEGVKEVPFAVSGKSVPYKVGVTEGEIESAEIEDSAVDIAPGMREKQQCLVVRVSHKPGAPVWVRLGDAMRGRGEEHAYFHEAGKYTAKFYPVPENLDKIDLQVLCIESFKNAKGTTLHAGFAPEGRIVPQSNLYKRLDENR